MKKLINVEEADIIKRVSEFKNPCDNCWMKNNGCCGCPDRGAYEQLINPIKDVGLSELLNAMTKYKELNNKISDLKKELNKYKKIINSYIVIEDEEKIKKDYLFK